MIAGINLFDLGSGRWENTNKLVDSDGNLVKVSIAKDFSEAIIRNEQDEPIAFFEGNNGRHAILQAIKNWLIDEAEVKFVIDNNLRYADNLELEAVSDSSISFSPAPTSGQLVLDYDGDLSAAILHSDSAEQIQEKLRAIPGLEGVEVTGSIEAGLSVFFVFVPNPQILAVDSNTLQQDSVQTISFNPIPDAGTFSLDFDGSPTIALDFDVDAQTLQEELALLGDLGAVRVIGSVADGFTVVLEQSVNPALLAVDTNTLTSDLDPVVIDINEEVEYEATVVTI
jgi:hypothetical protein